MLCSLYPLQYQKTISIAKHIDLILPEKSFSYEAKIPQTTTTMGPKFYSKIGKKGGGGRQDVIVGWMTCQDTPSTDTQPPGSDPHTSCDPCDEGSK